MLSLSLEWIDLNFRPWVSDQSRNGFQNKHQSQSRGTWKKIIFLISVSIHVIIFFANSFKAEKRSSRANFGPNFAKKWPKKAIFGLDSWPQYMVSKQIWLILMIFSDLSLDLDNKNLTSPISASNGLHFFLKFYLSLGLESPKNWALISVLNELKVLPWNEPWSQPLKKI